MTRDETLRLVRGGYPQAALLRAGRTAVPIRLLGRRSALVGGPDGVRRFYDERLRRRGAFPQVIKQVLFGPGAVHGLDDAEHHARKALFADILAPAQVARLTEVADAEWRRTVADWSGQVAVFNEAVALIGRSVLAWSGIPAEPAAAQRRARQLAAIVDGFATPVRPYLRAVRARRDADRWARGLVEQVRDGSMVAEPGTALHVFATARDATGDLLPVRTAGVELLNVVRPTVAVAWFVAFAAEALHAYPDWRQRIAGGDVEAADAFAQEVRRFYPFVPVLAARARGRQDVSGVDVPRNGYVVLDVHGTDHDPASWREPDRFDPARFLAGPVDPDALVPQGGGDVATGHRCPGEVVVLSLLAGAVRALAGLDLVYPPQDVGASLSRFPTRPRSGVIVRIRG